MAGGGASRPDTLKQTDQPAISANPLADGAGHTFFEAELLGVNEIPHRSIIDLEAALSQFSHQAPQSEGAVRTRRARKAACSPAIALGLRPPIRPGATLPVSPNRRTQLITVLGATPKRATDSCRDSPSFKTAATARWRRSIEYRFAIHAGLLPSQHGESERR